MKNIIAILLMAFISTAWTDGTVAITGVTARQRYPWNGLVDIVVTIQGDTNEIAQTECTFAATNSATLVKVPVTAIRQEGADSFGIDTCTRCYIWNATNDVGTVKIDDLALTVDVQKKLGGVQLWENGPYWAECNIGATKPEEYGYYFWWGDTVGYKRNAANNGWVSVKDGTSFQFYDSNCPTYGKGNSTLKSLGYIDSTGNLVAAHDAATAHLGAPWRMPTDEEMSALISNCTTTLTSRNGVYGRLVTGKGTYASKSIFLPAAGRGRGSYLDYIGSNGNYWSSTPNSDNSNNAWNLNFNSSNFNRNNNNRNNGQSVRPLRALASASTDGASHRFLEDIYRAYLAARRHKRGKGYQIRFEMNQERELVKLRDELIERRYKPRPSSCFIIHDPKMREVFAADFRDRIVHHLFYNYTHKIFERTFIADSYSCIEGRGTHFGIHRLEHHIRSCSQNWSRPSFILKLDVKGYFMHIDRAVLLARCREILAKSRARNGEGAFGGAPAEFIDYLLEKICLLNPLEDCRVVGDTAEWRNLPQDKSLFAASDGCGLPIGNLSSQLFSNVYLGMLDDYVKRELKVAHYGRYVDDVFIVGDSKEYLKSLICPVRSFLRDRLHLDLSENKTHICDARQGVEFLGAFVKPFRTYVASRSLRRIRSHLHAVTPRMNARRAQAVLNSSLGVLSHYASYDVRRVLVGESKLSQFGKFSEDGLRYYPNALDWTVYQLKKGEKR